MGLHQRYARWMEESHIALADGDGGKAQELYRKLTHKFDRMMRAMFGQKGATFDLSLLATDEAQDFISTHASVLDATFSHVEMSDRMRSRLTRSNYIFSGMKAFHEMNEAFPSLLDENGDRKPFERFLNDVRKIDETYNKNYLRAEYNFVQASALMAAKWEDFAEDGDRYLLQYRTAGDDKVRPEHAELNGITLHMSDKFWESYYPPNGWNCRCTVVQVRRGKYTETPHDEAMARGSSVLDGEKLSVFRFNSGKQEKTVPDYNPYTIRRCRDCDVAKEDGSVKLALPDNEVCAACRMIHKCAMDKDASRLCVEKKTCLGESANFTLASKALKTGRYFQTKTTLSLGLWHARTMEEVYAFKWIPKHLDQLSFVRFSPLGEVKDMSSEKDVRNIEKKKKRDVTGYNVYEVKIGDSVWQLKTEVIKGRKETLYIAFKKR